MTDGQKPASGPAGGGGGSGLSPDQGGTGYAGQVKLTYSSSTIPAANVFRFVLDVPSTGGTDGAVLLRATTAGTVAKVEVIYHTGGNLQLKCYNGGGSTTYDSTSLAAGANGTPMMVSAELTVSGANVATALRYIKPGDVSATTLATGSVSTATMGGVNSVVVNPGGTEVAKVGIGHITVQYALVSLSTLGSVLAANAGERAGTRFTRLCTEEGIAYTLTGNASDTPQMGAQPNSPFVTLLQQCEDADAGLLYETRDKLGVGYRTRVNMQNQPVVASLNYAAAQLSAVPEPVDDDQLIRNDVTISRTGGSSVRVTLATGAMSTQAPPNGVGSYDYSKTVNLYADSQLTSMTQWVLAVGTVDEFRWPVFEVDLVRSEVAGTPFASLPALIAGDYFNLTNPPDFVQSGTVKQLAFGFTETLNSRAWKFEINAVPESPYEGGGLPSW